MSKEDAAGIILPVGAIMFITLLIILGFYSIYDDEYSDLDKYPTFDINYTGQGPIHIEGSVLRDHGCYYEGRKYGCERNLSEMLELEEINK